MYTWAIALNATQSSTVGVACQGNLALDFLGRPVLDCSHAGGEPPREEYMTEPLIVREGHDGERLYDWKGVSRPSVTSIIRHGVAKPQLIQWAANKVTAIAVEHRKELAALSQIKAKKLIDALWDGDRLEAAGRGTTIHEQAENYALGKRVDITPEIEGYVQAFDHFCYDFRPVFLNTEALVISETHGYAGTLDAIVEIEGKVYVLDIKTGNYIWPEVALQLVAYARADYMGDKESGEETKLPVLHKRGLVLHLSATGYSLRPVRLGDTEFDCFLAALDMYHWSTDTSKSVLLPEWRK